MRKSVEEEKSRMTEQESLQADRVQALKEYLARFHGAIFPQDLAVVAAEKLLQAAEVEEREAAFFNQDNDGKELPPDAERDKYIVAPHRNLSKLYRRTGEGIQKLMAHFAEEEDRAVMPR